MGKRTVMNDAKYGQLEIGQIIYKKTNEKEKKKMIEVKKILHFEIVLVLGGK